MPASPAIHTATLLALGLAAGVLSGTLGVGSGILLVPALVVLLGVPQKSAQGTCLTVMVPMALVGAIRYKLNPAVEVSLTAAVLVAAGAIAGALVGTELMARLPARLLRQIFAVFLILVAARMLLARPGPSTPPAAAQPEGALAAPASPGGRDSERDN